MTSGKRKVDVRRNELLTQLLYQFIHLCASCLQLKARPMYNHPEKDGDDHGARQINGV